MDKKTQWNQTVEVLEHAYRLREFTCQLIKYPKYREYQPLFTTQDEWTIAKYIMEGLTPFQYCIRLMSKTHRVMLHRVITVYNQMFNRMDGVMRAVSGMKPQWKDALYFAMKFQQEKLSTFYAQVTPTTCKVLISAQILNPFRKLQSFQKWDKGMGINTKDKTSYTTKCQKAFSKVCGECILCQISINVQHSTQKRCGLAIYSPPQMLLNLVNYLCIHIMCPAMMKNTSCLKERLK